MNRYSIENIINAVDRSKKAFSVWSKLDVEERINLFQKLKEVIIKETDSLCELITKENGKTIFESLYCEVILIPYFIDYFCSVAKKNFK